MKLKAEKEHPKGTSNRPFLFIKHQIKHFKKSFYGANINAKNRANGANKMNIHHLHTNTVASITALKRDPMGTINSGTAESGAIAILNRNQPAFYCVTPELFEYFQELAENAELVQLAQERKESGKIIAVNIDDL